MTNIEKLELSEQLQPLNQRPVSVFIYFVMKKGIVKMANVNERAVSGIKMQLLQKVQELIESLEREEFSLLLKFRK